MHFTRSLQPFVRLSLFTSIPKISRSRTRPFRNAPNKAAQPITIKCFYNHLFGKGDATPFSDLPALAPGVDPIARGVLHPPEGTKFPVLGGVLGLNSLLFRGIGQERGDSFMALRSFRLPLTLSLPFRYGN